MNPPDDGLARGIVPAPSGVEEPHATTEAAVRLPVAVQGLVLLVFAAILFIMLFGLPALFGRTATGTEDTNSQTAAF